MANVLAALLLAAGIVGGVWINSQLGSRWQALRGPDDIVYLVEERSGAVVGCGVAEKFVGCFRIGGPATAVTVPPRK